MQYTDIRFPHLGIVLSHVGRYISIGNFQIMFYGIIIACGFLAGLVVAQQEAKRTGQNPEIYMDYLLWMMIPAIIGARIYYVVFSWDAYKDNIPEIFNLRHGGLGIVGGVIMAIIVLLIFAKVRKQYGRVSELKTSGILDHLVTLTVNGEKLSYIQVHPTFLYEGLWNLLILLCIFLYRKHKKFDGELLCIYLMGYGAGRFFIEGLRVDQLIIGHTGIAVTQVVCICIFVGGLLGMILGRIRHKKGKAC